MPPKRKIIFDAEAAKTHAKKKKSQVNAISEIQEIGSSFMRLVEKCESVALSTCDCDAATLELFLVAKVGLIGAYWINLAMKVVPENHPNRLQEITSMVNFSLSESKKVQSNMVETLMQIATKSIPSTKKYSDALCNYAMATGQPTHFLTPPVSTCINSACSLCGMQNSLSAHHGETPVTLYNFDGPQPGIKQALKCRSCSYIYNYSKYGRKRSEGERFYDSERDYIEVSDSIFCSRRFHNMYCYLQ